MAISRAAAAAVAGNTILAASWEAEFNNIINNALALVSPWTGNMDAGNFRLIDLNLGTVGDPAVRFEADANTGIYSSAADTVNVAAGGVLAAQFGAQSILAAVPEDARTNTVDVAHIFRSTTSGVPAANIGIGVQFDAESGDENPSVFGRIDFVATDILAGSEDTVMDILLRTAGAAEGSRYRFQATGAFLATITHAASAARTYTLPDSTGTILTNTADVALAAATSPPTANAFSREALVKGWVEVDDSNTAAIVASYNVSSITDDADPDFTVVWNTDFADANYAVVAMAESAGGVPDAHGYDGKLVGSVQIEPATGSATLNVTVIAIGNQ